jgi:hypothetical protein
MKERDFRISLCEFMIKNYKDYLLVDLKNLCGINIDGGLFYHYFEKMITDKYFEKVGQPTVRYMLSDFGRFQCEELKKEIAQERKKEKREADILHYTKWSFILGIVTLCITLIVSIINH